MLARVIHKTIYSCAIYTRIFLCSSTSFWRVFRWKNLKFFSSTRHPLWIQSTQSQRNQFPKIYSPFPSSIKTTCAIIVQLNVDSKGIRRKKITYKAHTSINWTVQAGTKVNCVKLLGNLKFHVTTNFFVQNERARTPYTTKKHANPFVTKFNAYENQIHFRHLCSLIYRSICMHVWRIFITLTWHTKRT